MDCDQPLMYTWVADIISHVYMSAPVQGPGLPNSHDKKFDVKVSNGTSGRAPAGALFNGSGAAQKNI